MSDCSYELNDLVWAKMKGFPPWPGRVSEPIIKLGKKPNNNSECIFFFGTNDYAWVEVNSLRPYFKFKENLTKSCYTIPFKEAIRAIEQYIEKNGTEQRRLCDGCQTSDLSNGSHNCRSSLIVQFQIGTPQNNSPEDPIIPKLNKYSLIKSKNDEPTISNSLPTVNKKLQKNTSSLGKSGFNDASASKVKRKKPENVAKLDMPKLIEVIEKYEPLWNSKLPREKKTDAIKTNLWNNVYVHFNGKYSITVLQKSWNYLKVNYSRLQNPFCRDNTNTEWIHLRSLRFLDYKNNIPKTSTESDMGEPSTRKKKSSMEDNISMLMNKSKNSRPIPTEHTPTEAEQLNEDKNFCSYLTSLMAGIPRDDKLKLQNTLINMVYENII